MKKIVLLCCAGASTGVVVKKMIEYAKKIDLDCDISAHSVSEAKEHALDADCILLGPQVRFELDNVKSQFPDKPIDVIDMADYGRMNGENVLKKALKMIGE